MKTCLIIGGGLGGLVSGALLAKEGYAVTVLEKNAIIGGGLQTFKRHGVSFPTGMHVFGGFGEGGQLHRLFSYLGIMDRLSLKAMDDDGYDVVTVLEDLHHIGTSTLFVAHSQVATQTFGIGRSTLGGTQVRSGNQQVVDVHLLDVVDEDAGGIQGIHRDVEEALDLVGVEVHRDDAVHMGGSQHVSHQLRADAHAGLVLTVLTGPAEIRYHSDDLMCRGTLGGVNHKQQLHQVVGRRHGGLNDEHVMPTDALFERRLKLAVGEDDDLRLTQLGAIGFGNLGAQILGGPTGENGNESS